MDGSRAADRRTTLALGAAAVLLGTALSRGGYLAGAAVMLSIAGALAASLLFAGWLTRRRAALVLWIVLVSHRAFSLRAEAPTTVQAGLETARGEIIVTMLVAVGAAFLVARNALGRERVPVLVEHRLLAVYAIVAAVSLAWAPNPLYGAFWLVRLASALIIVVAYMHEADAGDRQVLVDATLIAMLPYIGLVIWAYLSGQKYTQERLAGFWLHPAILAIVAFAVALVSLAEALRPDASGRRRAVHGLMAAFAFWGGFLSGGKSGALGAALALAFYVLSRRDMRSAVQVSILGGVAALLLWSFGSRLEVGLLRHLTYYAEVSRFASIGARLEIWQGVIALLEASPLAAFVGYGFTATRTLGIPVGAGYWLAGHAHSSVLQPILEVGLAGGVPIVVMVTRAMWTGVRLTLKGPTSPALPWTAGLAVLFIASLVDNVYGGLLLPPFYLLLALVSVIAQEGTLEREDRRDAPAA